MKRIVLALLAAAGLAATTARAEHRDIRASIHVGSPAYAPGYYGWVGPSYGYSYAPARGYWREVTVPVFVPGRWVIRREGWGRTVRMWEPPHREYRTERVWVSGGRDYHHHDHDYGRSYERGRGYGPHWNG